MTSIANTVGVGSGIDTEALVAKLVDATYTPKTAALKVKEDQNAARISALASASGSIGAFTTSLSTLIAGGTLSTQPTSSDTTILGVTARPGARLGGLSTQLQVRQLAQAQSLVSGYLTAASAPAGQGDLTLTTARGSFTLTIGAGNDSLTGLSQAINAANAGVSASVVTDANGARLIVKADATGAANAFSLTPAAEADPGLARFRYDASVQTMTRAQEALDAIVRVDGVDVARASNTVADLVDGVTLDLKTAAPGTIVTLGAVRPTAAIAQAVSDFVAAYNELKTQLDTAISAGVGGKDAGPLRGDVGVAAMQRQLARITTTKLSSAGSVSTLSEIGVATNRDGSLRVDQARLNAALVSDPDGVEAMFNPGQRVDSALVRITSPMGRAKPGTYALADLVPAGGGGNASGKIAGLPGIVGVDGRTISASVTTAAYGLAIEPLGTVASATVTVDAGLGGALQTIRDALQAANGPLAASNATYAKQKTRLADQRTELTAAQASYKDKLAGQFGRMDAAVAAYKSTQSFLTQQIDIWTKKDS